MKYFIALLIFFLAYWNCKRAPVSTEVTFKKIIVDTTFRSESITSADINQDKLIDIVIGDVWYAAPDWSMHEIRTAGEFTNTTAPNWETKSDLPYYSNSFATQILDVNKDGWPDVLVYPVMNSPIYWYENPKKNNQHWKERKVVNAYHGESPILGQIQGRNKAHPIAGVVLLDSLLHLVQMSPPKDIESLWDTHTIGSTAIKSYRGPGWDKLSKWFAPGARGHGLGTGDINGNGLEDVVTAKGWYEAPQDTISQNWTFHPISFDSIVSPEYPQYQFAQMPIVDLDQDGDNDLFTTSAHRYGLWWFENIKTENGITFVKHIIPYQISQAHAVAVGDINSNGIPDIVTGKRWLAHNGNDPGWDEPAELLWLEPFKNEAGKTDFKITVIDDSAGVGTQIELTDIDLNGKIDILISNKKGTTLFLQE